MLETSRLILRPFRESDIEAAHTWFSDPEVFRFYTGGQYPYRSLEETGTRIHEYMQHYEKQGFGKCIVIDKATGTAVGDAGLMLDEPTAEIHVGYKLARAWWGRGIATEAAKEWIRYGFDKRGLEQIYALVHPQNAASIRVVEKLKFSLSRQRREAGLDWNIFVLRKGDGVVRPLRTKSGEGFSVKLEQPGPRLFG